MGEQMSYRPGRECPSSRRCRRMRFFAALGVAVCAAHEKGRVLVPSLDRAPLRECGRGRIPGILEGPPNYALSKAEGRMWNHREAKEVTLPGPRCGQVVAGHGEGPRGQRGSVKAGPNSDQVGGNSIEVGKETGVAKWAVGRVDWEGQPRETHGGREGRRRGGHAGLYIIWVSHC